MILSIKNLKVYFYTDRGTGKAVDNVSFHVEKGKVIAIVGESGCGKSVTAKSILKLIESPGKIVSGEILYKGKNILNFSNEELRKFRGKEISMIFQDPMNSLNPVFTVGEQLIETVLTHKNISFKQAKKIGIKLFENVKLPEPEKIFNMYPHQLSGGMRQRVMIAIALCCEPEILIADEPTTALDVSIQKEIILLLKNLQKEKNLTIIFITHDFRIVAEIADEVIVMYGGKIIEKREKENIFKNPAHPYTIGLINSLPPLNQKINRLRTIKGSVPDIYSDFKGCKFANRCEIVSDICRVKEPPFVNLNDKEYLFCFNKF